MEYSEFLKKKISTVPVSGFEISDEELNPMLFDFQKFTVKLALKKGKFAIFFDCGLGKTFIQLEWAKHVVNKTNKSVLILTPLAVSKQTINEGNKFNIEVKKLENDNYKNSIGIYITNYEQLDNIDSEYFIGIVADESSLMKHFEEIGRASCRERV